MLRLSSSLAEGTCSAVPLLPRDKRVRALLKLRRLLSLCSRDALASVGLYVMRGLSWAQSLFTRGWTGAVSIAIASYKKKVLKGPAMRHFSCKNIRHLL